MWKSKLIGAVLIAFAALTLSVAAFAQVQMVVSFGPPELPVYEQPMCPGEGYIWTPGYWAWDGVEYFWVPGTWVMAPQPGYLWTPGYWAWNGNGYYFNQGYWAPEVGYYGGIDYGWGYPGRGYYGGRWQDGRFYYNRSVNNVNVTNIRYVYNTTVVNNYDRPRVSYNGGRGGVNARPTPQEERAAHERHLAPIAAQVQHREQAQADPALRAKQNHGKPPVAATPRPTDFKGSGVVPAREGGNYNPPARAENNNERVPRPGNNGQEPRRDNDAQYPRPGNNNHPARAVHPNDLPPVERGNTPDTGNAKNDRKYEQQQEKLYTRQEEQRQKLQNQQEQQHQRAQGHPDQQMEQRHEMQTQKLEQRQMQQQQRLETRQQPHQEQPRMQAQQPPQVHPQEQHEPRGDGKPRQ